MAFEYGAQKLNIRNPFRFEGLVRSIRGAILLAIGVYLLFQVKYRPYVQAAHRGVGVPCPGCTVLLKKLVQAAGVFGKVR